MSQTAKSIVPTPKHIQWNPVKVLNIPLDSDGLYYCSGVRHKSTNPCRWQLEETNSTINNLLLDISSLPPKSAIDSLNTLADLSLCKYHKSQSWHIVPNWTEAINRLSSTHVESNIMELHGSLPSSSQPTESPGAAPSLPLYGDTPASSFKSYNRPQDSQNSCPTLIDNNTTSEEHTNKLYEEVMFLKTRVDFLEANYKKISYASCHPKKRGSTWARLLSRLKAFLSKNPTSQPTSARSGL